MGGVIVPRKPMWSRVKEHLHLTWMRPVCNYSDEDELEIANTRLADWKTETFCPSNTVLRMVSANKSY